MNSKKYIPYIYVLPAILLMSVFIVMPVLKSTYLSFFDWDGFSSKVFNGLGNYRKVVQSEVFFQSLFNNFYLFFLVTVGSIVLGLILSLAIVNNKSVNFYRVVFYLPAIISLTASGLLWKNIYEPNYGLLNSLLNGLGLSNLTRVWLGDEKLVLVCIAITAVWQSVGLIVILFVTAMNNIPDELYESAYLDGATPLLKVVYITLPLIKSVFLVVTLLTLISSFKAFDIVLVMSAGGPGTSSYVLGILMYDKAFNSMQYNYATAVGVIMTIIIATVSLLYMKLTGYHNESAEY